MPYIFTKLAYGEKLPHISKRLNPARNHMVWIRGMDFEPVLVAMADISKEEARLDAVKRELTT